MDGNGMLVWLVFFPMAGAGFTYLVGRRNKTARDYVADIIVVLEFLAALYVFGMSNIAWQLSKNLIVMFLEFAGWGCILLWMDSGLCMG